MVADELSGQRVDKVLATHPQILSRSQAAQIIQLGFATVNGKIIKASYKVNSGDVVKFEIQKTKSLELTPYNFDLEVVYEDQDVIVINKPSGLVVHPAAGNESNTLVNALIFHAKKLAPSSTHNRPGIVHRIDKDTSGLIVVAKTESALRSLAAQFKEKSTHRVYYCLCYGCPRNSSGKIVSRLARHPSDRKRFASTKSEGLGRVAITHFKVLKSTSSLSLVQCVLETGRTHQIRVHMSELGHPIVADPIYSTSRRANNLRSNHVKNTIASISRLMLHAAELGFKHPRTGKKMLFKADWPANVKAALVELDML